VTPVLHSRRRRPGSCCRNSTQTLSGATVRQRPGYELRADGSRNIATALFDHIAAWPQLCRCPSRRPSAIEPVTGVSTPAASTLKAEVAAPRRLQRRRHPRQGASSSGLERVLYGRESLPRILFLPVPRRRGGAGRRARTELIPMVVVVPRHHGQDPIDRALRPPPHRTTPGRGATPSIGWGASLSCPLGHEKPYHTRPVSVSGPQKKDRSAPIAIVRVPIGPGNASMARMTELCSSTVMSL
jgi:hypothetical protein